MGSGLVSCRESVALWREVSRLRKGICHECRPSGARSRGSASEEFLATISEMLNLW